MGWGGTSWKRSGGGRGSFLVSCRISALGESNPRGFHSYVYGDNFFLLFTPPVSCYNRWA